MTGGGLGGIGMSGIETTRAGPGAFGLGGIHSMGSSGGGLGARSFFSLSAAEDELALPVSVDALLFSPSD